MVGYCNLKRAEQHLGIPIRPSVRGAPVNLSLCLGSRRTLLALRTPIALLAWLRGHNLLGMSNGCAHEQEGKLNRNGYQ